MKIALVLFILGGFSQFFSGISGSVESHKKVESASYLPPLTATHDMESNVGNSKASTLSNLKSLKSSRITTKMFEANQPNQRPNRRPKWRPKGRNCVHGAYCNKHADCGMP